MSEDRYVEVFRDLQMGIFCHIENFYAQVNDTKDVWMDDDRAYRILEICQGDSTGWVEVPVTWWDHFKMTYNRFIPWTCLWNMRRIYIGNSGQDKFIDKSVINKWMDNA